MFELNFYKSKNIYNMKKVVFTLLAFSSLMVLSCRQQEDMMDSEDLKSLSVLQEAKNKVNNIKPESQKDLKIVKKDSTINTKEISLSIESFSEMDGEIKIPPR